MKSINENFLKRGISYQFILVMIAAWAVVMTFMVPTWQTPDENAHIAEIGRALDNDNLSQAIMSDIDLQWLTIMSHPENKINISEWKAAMTKSPDYDKSDCLPKGIHLLVIKHLPAVIGMEIGIVCGLPSFWVMELAELFSVAFYIAICWIALRIMPAKREIMLFFMAFPMTIHQISSISYDAVLIPLIFLFIAYTMKLYDTDDHIGWKEYAIWAGILLLITYIKMPYVALGILFFGIPFEKTKMSIGKFQIDGEFIHKYRWVLRGIIVLVIVAGLYYMRNNYFVALLYGMLGETKQLIRLFLATISNFGVFLLNSSVGNFGWLDTPLPNWFVFATYILLFVVTCRYIKNRNATMLTGKQILVVLITFLAQGFLLTTSMVNHTIMIILFGSEQAQATYNIKEAIYNIPYIGGLQGRYYLPIIPLFFLAIGKSVTTKKEQEKSVVYERVNWIVLGYVIVAAILTIITLYHRYWQA